jgi:Zn-dependent peptidase ImmA (M78 family)
MTAEATIQRRANQLLTAAGITSPPVDVNAIARGLGAVVRFEPSDADVSGALYRRGGQPVIGINSKDAPVRQRFSLAHEIGHLVLHDEPLFIDRHYVREDAKELSAKFWRNSVSSQATDSKEVEANKFAACLLMPWSLLQQDIQQLTVPIRSVDLGKLARRYRVSEQAMLFRLQNRGVPIGQT